ncbi:hypothetical protein COB21_03260 [Candidatus Aerophobetes bacterium]|uniref:Uncharacterized protein n=1 Tax=Aerophobetes bacterium TaxID=2030807 RepID=A0A2A4X582_UNCAE|nr:MAG: hypothetical protein COB21_03260 [Candidatus Aerophobetes bacterium]
MVLFHIPTTNDLYRMPYYVQSKVHAMADRVVTCKNIAISAITRQAIVCKHQAQSLAFRVTCTTAALSLKGAYTIFKLGCRIRKSSIEEELTKLIPALIPIVPMLSNLLTNKLREQCGDQYQEEFGAQIENRLNTEIPKMIQMVLSKVPFDQCVDLALFCVKNFSYNNVDGIKEFLKSGANYYLDLYHHTLQPTTILERLTGAGQHFNQQAELLQAKVMVGRFIDSIAHEITPETPIPLFFLNPERVKPLLQQALQQALPQTENERQHASFGLTLLSAFSSLISRI